MFNLNHSARCKTHRCVSFLAAGSVFVASVCLATDPDPATPAGTVHGLNCALLDAMKQGDTIGFDKRYQRLKPDVTSSFALEFMARKSIGRYWTELENAQKSAYLDAYVQFSIATYASRFKRHAGERFEIISVSEPVNGTVTVESHLTKTDKKAVPFLYKLRRGNKGWKIVDIHIEGVSQLALTRSQYTSVIREKGFEGLQAKIKNKIEECAREETP